LNDECGERRRLLEGKVGYVPTLAVCPKFGIKSRIAERQKPANEYRIQ
jgi:hypothetical protein